MDGVMTTEYQKFLEEIKRNFKNSQIKASMSVNSALLEFYWYLGEKIVQEQKAYQWGSDFLSKLSRDLSREFSGVKGFSKSNLQYIKRWYLFYKDAKVEQVVPLLVKIPWGHNLVIISKSKDMDEALFYVENTIKHGISRSVLVHQIESKLYEREGKAVTNFSQTLPPAQSDLAKELLKDPYHFDFLTMTKDYNEKELEEALCENITNFLLELGQGFAFVGRQYKLQVGESEYRIDLLFYHLKLRCYVVVELKAVAFQPEFVGKLNFYTNAVDGEIKEEQDNPTIGILICKSKENIVVEYALKDIDKPLGVSEYRLTTSLPSDFKSSLPSIEAIEEELKRIEYE